MSYPTREEIPWTDEELRLLHKVWLAVHSRRFEHGPGPDNIYNGVRMAEEAIREIAGMSLGYSYGWLPKILAGG